ncbi:hypothetical protein VTI28DRAFT_9211 [Corynascus sepedonium]
MTVKIWEVATGACTQTLEGHSRSINSVAFSADSTLVVSASDDMTVKIWEVATGACTQTLEGHSRSINSVAFSADSTLVVSGSEDRTVKIWEVATGRCKHTTNTVTPLQRVSFDNTGSRLHTDVGYLEPVLRYNPSILTITA